MKAYLFAVLLAAGLVLTGAAPSIASSDKEDWWSRNFTSLERAPTAARSATTRRSTQSANAPAKQQRASRVASTDDGSRPQRRAATQPAPQRSTVSSGSTLSGVASYYWQPQPVASGGRFNPDALTAAHKTLPFGTRVRVTRADTGRSVEVVINDRGPYIAGRIIDLSRRAAQVIGMTDVGITRVSVQVLGRG